MSDKFGLGRIHVEDSRDQDFLMSDALPAESSDRTYKYWWPSGWWGNQGTQPHCVAFAWMHYLEDGPITHFYEMNDEDYEKPLYKTSSVYHEAQRKDRWPGENYAGTSVRAGAKVLASKGVIKEYRWAWDVETVVQALLETGPVVVGTRWYRDMFYPDDEGKIKVGGSVAGGHAYLLNGVNTEKGIIRLKNSWGRGWGKKGYAYISIEDMDRLIKENGEACIALETKLETT